jgi:hypothetical protein
MALIIILYTLLLSLAFWLCCGGLFLYQLVLVALVVLTPVLVTLFSSLIVVRGLLPRSSTVVLMATCFGCYAALNVDFIFSGLILAVQEVSGSARLLTGMASIGSALRLGGTIGATLVLSFGILEALLQVFVVAGPRMNMAMFRVPLLAIIVGTVIESVLVAISRLY